MAGSKILGLPDLGDDFVSNRNRTEFSLRQRSDFLNDVSLVDIYSELEKAGLIPPGSAGALLQLEFEADLRDQRPRTSVVTLINTLIAEGRRVVFVSDTYYSSAQVRKMLLVSGVIGHFELFVSSEVLERKDTQRMWSQVCHVLKINYSELIHFGDNVVSDVQRVGDLRIANGLMLSVLDKAGLQLGRNLNSPAGWNSAVDDGLYPVICALGRNPFFADRDGGGTIHPYDFEAFRDYGISLLGPMLNAYFAGLMQQCRARNTQVVAFVSREGVFLHRAFQAYCRGRGLTQKSVHVPASRSLLLKFLIPEGAGRFVIGGEYQGGAGHYLSSKLALPDLAGSRDSTAAPWWDLQVRLPQDNKHLLKILNHLFPLLEPRNEEKKNAFVSYLGSLGVDENCIFADVGYSGSIQNLINWLLKKNIDGYYIVSAAEKIYNPHYMGTVDALFPSDDKFGAGNPLLDSSLVFEAIMSADHGQVDDFDNGGGGLDWKFTYGPRGRAQHMHTLLDGVQGAIADYLENAGNVPENRLTSAEFISWIRNYSIRMLEHPASAPALLKEIGEVDDRISGLGMLNPWNYLPTFR